MEEETTVHRRRLKRDLEKKRKEYEKLNISPLKLFSTSFFKEIYRRRLRRLLSQKRYRLLKEISELEKEIKRHEVKKEEPEKQDSSVL